MSDTHEDVEMGNRENENHAITGNRENENHTIPGNRENENHTLAPPLVYPETNPSLNISRDSETERSSRRTDEESDMGYDRDNIGLRYACPNLGCGTGGDTRPVYTNPKYAQSNNAGKRRYPTLDRPPSRATSSSTVHSASQSTQDLMKSKDSKGPLDKLKDFWKNPKYDKLRALVLIILLIVIILLIIIIPLVLQYNQAGPKADSVTEYTPVYAPFLVCSKDTKRTLQGLHKNGVSVFKGIPYAVPPVAEKRWKPAIGLTPETCLELYYPRTIHFAHQCYQSPVVSAESNESEDCLYLNVWTPGNATNADKLPVMVWIHEGDFRSGSGNDIALYPVEQLVSEGQFVLVSFNYRLQALGFMAVEALAESNVGLSDQIEALTWVKDNIAGFGGDPLKVTVFGLGSGGTSILALMNSNFASGLFHRAWLMSPGVVQDQPLLATQAFNSQFVKNLGCLAATIQETRTCLYQKSAAEILAAVPWYEGPQWAQPQKFDLPQKDNITGPYIVADNIVGSVGTFEALDAKTFAHADIPVIIGNADADADVNLPKLYFGDGSSSTILNINQYNAIVRDRLVQFSADIMPLIAASYPELETELGFARLVSDIRAICPANQIAEKLQLMNNVNVFRYIYKMAPTMRLSAFEYDFWAAYTFHGVDMLAFFGMLDGPALGPFFPAGQKFSANLRAAIFKFIKGEQMTWSPLPHYMALDVDKETPVSAVGAGYPRNCSYWDDLNMIPKYAWSN